VSATRTAGTHGRGPGRLAAAAVRFWQSVRPTTRRGAALGLVLVLGGAAVLAAAFLVGAAMAWSPYIDSSVHPDSNPRSWAALQPVYADSGSCTECHAPEAAKAAIASHSGIGCESCHGPLRLHVDSSRGTYVATREIARRFEATLRAAYPARSADAFDALTTADRPWPGPAILWARLEKGRPAILRLPPRGVAVGR